MLTLYQYGHSVCTQKVRVTLCEKGLQWETRNVDLVRDRVAAIRGECPKDFRRLKPG